MLFFIAILIGGRGSILGPLLGTILLTVLPEFAAPLVAWSTFLYAALLLVIVLAMPGGIAELLDFRNRQPLARRPRDRAAPGPAAAGAGPSRGSDTLRLAGVMLRLRRRARDRRPGSWRSGPARCTG